MRALGLEVLVVAGWNVAFGDGFVAEVWQEEVVAVATLRKELDPAQFEVSAF
jgi:hypothetical protein